MGNSVGKRSRHKEDQIQEPVMGNGISKSSKQRQSMKTANARDRLYRAQDSVWKQKVTIKKPTKDDDAASDKSDEEEADKNDNRLDNSQLDDTDLAPRIKYWQQKRQLDMTLSYTAEENYANRDIDLSCYQFPFENLVFEGGGNKGLAYCGGIKLLEELGLMSQIRRFAGSSAGAMTAALLAVGYKADDIQRFLSQNLAEIFLDHSCGYLSLLPNLVTSYGWNPGKRILKWFGDALKEKTKNPDITFAQLYKERKVELCITVTNLSMMNVEYFHPKTTPNVSIRNAVRMSMAIPGLFEACRQETYGMKNVYIDGGVLCNYPIRCFDGWWLSMKKDDRFLKRLQPEDDLRELFEKQEMFSCQDEKQFQKTLGLLLYSEKERDVLRDGIEKRDRLDKVFAPATKLKKKKMQKQKEEKKAWAEGMRTRRAINAFFKVLEKHNVNEDDMIDKNELANALNDEEAFPKRYHKRIFGKNVSVEEAFEALDEDGSGEIEFNELRHFVERTGISIQTQLLGDQRKKVTNLISFFDTLKSTLLNNVKGVFVQEADVERTVGINTGHVDTTDFRLEEGDQKFVVQQGYRATEAFLKYFVVEKKPPLKRMESIVEDEEDDSLQNGHIGGQINRAYDSELDHVFTTVDTSGKANLLNNMEGDDLDEIDFPLPLDVQMDLDILPETKVVYVTHL